MSATTEANLDTMLRSYLDTQRRKQGIPAVVSWSPTAPPLAPRPRARVEHPEDERVTGEWQAAPTTDPNAYLRDRGVLLRLDSEGKGQVLSLAQGSTVLGRATNADLSLHEEGISRAHARIVFTMGAYVLEDLGSRNGTFVCGRPITSCTLHDGDLIQVGPRVTFRFTLMGAAEESTILQLYDGSTLDPLTRVHNRRHFDQRFQSELAFARRHGTDLAVILFDLDHFKQINDRHGHAVGDIVLTRVAEIFRQQLRTEDLVARYGGEEFIVLLRDEHLMGAGVLAERVRVRVASEQILIPSMATISATLSAGCASIRCVENPEMATMLARADARLYKAKGEGRNRVVISD